jgi:hypothetical protein
MPSLASTEGPTRVDFPPPPSSKKSAGVAAGVALGVLLLGALAVALRPSSPAGAGAQAKEPGPSAAPVASPGAPTPRLMLGSIPEGAQVLDGERLLGITPLEIPLDGAAGRSLTLRLEGHEPFSIGALPAETTRMVIPLKAAPAAPAGKGVRQNPYPVAKPVPPKTTAPPDQPPPPAIRMTR